MAKNKSKKHPIIAALLNFFFWGLGYVYLGKYVFGIILFVAAILLLAGVMSATPAVMDPTEFPQSSDAAAGGLVFASLFFLSLGLAFDAYNQAKKAR